MVLVLLGFIVGKSYPSVAGAVAMYLPTFGYFTVTMLPLAGIGLLRALWLPLLDVSPSLLGLGDVVFVPFILLVNHLGYRGYLIFIENLSWELMAVGVFIFFLGVLTWLYGKFKGYEIVDFWIYRVSRHPQYLGLLIWSYGLTLLMMFMPQFSGVWFLKLLPGPSLPWLIYALTLVAIALNEESRMAKKYSDRFMEYRGLVSFMLPLPKAIPKIITFPMKALLKKSLPENKKEIAYSISIYAVILISLSFFS
ncbi:hypothetical protein KEJ18_06795 [Candidatus Bathyarchaeota archaeon]|nr:hypothetical protein [Candidatus Bathyarchaeota archaeon]